MSGTAALNSAFFSTACWGVASQQIAVGFTYFALALVVSNTPDTPVLTRWLRWVLAGLAVGANVMQGADIGAIFSVFIAAFVLFPERFGRIASGEQAVVGGAVEHGGQLPGQVGGVAQPRTHALAEEGRRLVGGVTGQEESTVPPARRHQACGDRAVGRPSSKSRQRSAESGLSRPRSQEY